MLLAASPKLLGIQPNADELLSNNAVRQIAPRALTFRFDADQGIDAASLDGIRVTRPGPDGSFGSVDDLIIAASRETGSLGNDVILRFGEN
ncbi:MAG TPA: hypothetical protein VIY86_07795, partial [Pirellulaceae bacterium]